MFVLVVLVVLVARVDIVVLVGIVVVPRDVRGVLAVRNYLVVIV